LIQAVQRLVAKGHRLDDVLHKYTVAQVRAFLEAAAAEERGQAHDALVIGWTTARGKDKDAKALAKRLSRPPRHAAAAQDPDTVLPSIDSVWKRAGLSEG